MKIYIVTADLQTPPRYSRLLVTADTHRHQTHLLAHWLVFKDWKQSLDVDYIECTLQPPDSLAGPGSITVEHHCDNAPFNMETDSCEERTASFSGLDQSFATNLSDLTISSCSAIEKIGVATDHP
jgi:hypothetical protein